MLTSISALLILITYHLGDEAGQGFLHDFAGLTLYISALLVFVALDGAVRLIIGIRGKS